MSVLQKLRQRLSGGPTVAGSDRSGSPTPPATSTTEQPATSPFTESERLVAEGNFDEAIAALNKLNERSQSLQVERRIIDVRVKGAQALPKSELPEQWPPSYDDPFPEVVGRPPEITRAELNLQNLGGGIVNHGCLLIRGLFNAEQTSRAFDAVEQACNAQLAFHDEPKGSRWFHPLHIEGNIDSNESLRKMIASHGSVWMADSPAAMGIMIDALNDANLVELVGQYLGERPCISLQKSTLRRSDPEFRVVSWHQDGAFLDPGIRTVNVWVALSHCGGEDSKAPALELIPRRVNEIVEPDGGELAAHSLSGWAAHSLLPEGMEPSFPVFEPGDALLFDERFVHRTHLSETMTEKRYALENWMFAPTSSKGGYDMLLA